MLTPDELLAAVADVASRLDGVRPTDLPDLEDRDAGMPFLRVEGDRYVYAARERGRETFRHETTDVDELLWLVFHDVTRTLATRWEAGRLLRRRGRDPRRRWFPRWVALMTGLRPQWGDAHAGPRRRGPRRQPLPGPLSRATGRPAQAERAVATSTRPSRTVRASASTDGAAASAARAEPARVRDPRLEDARPPPRP